MTGEDAASRARWYVIQTKRHQETRAEANLQRWAIPTLAPMIREYLPSRKAPLSHRVTPLFPSYLFARFDADALFAKVRLTRGIQRVVGFGEYATPVDDSIIELLRSRMSENGVIGPPELRPGDQVEMVEGPLRSMTGIFERHLPASDRVVIFLNALGYSARVQLDRASLRASC